MTPKFAERPRKVGIVGGGLIGLSAAWRLAQRGFAVEIFDTHEAGAASPAAGGMLSAVAEAQDAPAELERACRIGRARWPAFASELEAASGQSVRLVETGTLIVAATAEEEERLQALAASAQGQLEFLDRRTWMDIEPGVSPRARAVLFAPEDGQVDNRAALGALRAALERASVVFHRARVERVILESGRAIGVRAEDMDVAADLVLVAAGVWSTGVFAASGLGDLLPAVEPVKGQMLALKMAPQTFVRHVIRGLGTYLVPRAGGRLIVGATSEQRGFDTATTPQGADGLLKAAAQLIPALRGLPILEHWAGLRPFISGGLPAIGETQVPGLFVAAGHYRNGVLLASLTADLLAGAICDTSPPLDGELLAAFAPARIRAVAARTAPPQPAVA